LFTVSVKSTNLNSVWKSSFIIYFSTVTLILLTLLYNMHTSNAMKLFLKKGVLKPSRTWLVCWIFILHEYINKNNCYRYKKWTNFQFFSLLLNNYSHLLIVCFYKPSTYIADIVSIVWLFCYVFISLIIRANKRQ
jgi:hypothetical protein